MTYIKNYVYKICCILINYLFINYFIIMWSRNNSFDSKDIVLSRNFISRNAELSFTTAADLIEAISFNASKLRSMVNSSLILQKFEANVNSPLEHITEDDFYNVIDHLEKWGNCFIMLIWDTWDWSLASHSFNWDIDFINDRLPQIALNELFSDASYKVFISISSY